MGVCDNSYRKVELPRSKSFFIVTKNNENQANSEQSSNDKVKLEFTIENCDVGQNYHVIAEFLNTNLPRFNTEIVKSHQNLIMFNTCYICDFFFQQPQLMRISIVKNGNIIGSTTPYLGMIVGSPNSTYKIGISPDKRESISISAFGITNYNSFVLINFLIRTNTPVE